MLRLIKFLLMMIETSFTGVRLIIFDRLDIIDIELTASNVLTKEEKRRVRLENLFGGKDDTKE